MNGSAQPSFHWLTVAMTERNDGKTAKKVGLNTHRNGKKKDFYTFRRISYLKCSVTGLSGGAAGGPGAWKNCLQQA